MNIDTEIRYAETNSLNLAYEQSGSDAGFPIILLHGFPYDVRQYDAVRRALKVARLRLVIPYLRGFGPTRFRDAQTIRSGQQAALGNDLIELLDALHIERAIVAGYDWGGRAACVAAALWPERIAGLLSASAYAIQNVAEASTAAKPAKAVYPLWYQAYLNTPQGEIGLEADRADFCRFLWQLWSPSWSFTDDEFLQTSQSFFNPDFIATVLHSYRHRVGNAAGDLAFRSLEERLAETPVITVPTRVLHGADDKVESYETIHGHERHFTGSYQVEVLKGIGHCVPAEAPLEFAAAIESLAALHK